MNRNDIITTIKSLANCQGFYSGLLITLESNTQEANEYLNFLVKKNFKDPLDLILYFES